ncbi:MAG: DUF167 family protein [Pseudomonadota bacterium]
MLDLIVHPKARRNAVVGIYNERLKLQITAAPTDGKANSHLCRWLAKQYGVSQKCVEILNGHHGRQKRVVINPPTKLPDNIAVVE